FRLASLPVFDRPVLVMETEIPCGEPPLHKPTDRGASTPTVWIARAHITVRVVDALHERPTHAPRLRPGCAHRLAQSRLDRIGMDVRGIGVPPARGERGVRVATIEAVYGVVGSRRSPVTVQLR